jgi:hypothetical protein
MMPNVAVVLLVVALLIATAVGVLLCYKAFQSRFIEKSYAFCTDEQFEHVKLEPNYLLKLHYLLHVSHAILTEANVPYVAVGGTLLAMQRDGYLTPWDDDGDLSVFKEEFTRQRAVVERLLRKHGLELRNPFWFANLEVFQLRLDSNHAMLREYPSESEPFVDWVLFDRMASEMNHPKTNEACYHHSSAGEREVFPHDVLYESELFPLCVRSLKAFSDKTARQLQLPNPVVQLVTPNNPDAYLNRCYGTKEMPEMWKSCYLASSHRSLGLFIKPCRLTAAQVNNM